jgi:hypothetical protein
MSEPFVECCYESEWMNNVALSDTLQCKGLTEVRAEAVIHGQTVNCPLTMW